MHGKGLPQLILLPLDYCNHGLAGKPKGIKRVLKEHSLWLERGLVLECPTTHNRPGCASEGSCCSCRVLGAERGFRDQKSRVCVCNLLFLYRYMRSEGPWQRRLFA